MEDRQSSRRRALRRWLLATIARAGPGARLPSDMRLAGRFDLSRGTVAATVKELVRDGRLVRRRGSGTFVPPLAQPQADPGPLLPVRSAVDRLVDRLQTMLADGTVRRGQSLPSIKYLTHQYHVSRRTVIDAYRCLADRGLIVKVGKSFWNQSPSDMVVPPGRKEVFLFVRNRDELSRVFVEGPYAASLRVMEDLLAAHGYVVRYSFYERLAALCRRWRLDPPHGLFFCKADKEEHALLTRLVRPLQIRHGAHLSILMEWEPKDIALVPRPFRHVSRLDMTLTLTKACADYVLRSGLQAGDFVIRQEDFYHEGIRSILLYDFLWMRAEIKRLIPSFDYRLVVIKARPDYTKRGFFATADIPALEKAAGWYTPVSGATLERETVFVDAAEQCTPPRRDGLLYFVQHDRDAATILDQLSRSGITPPHGAVLLSADNDPAYYHYGISRCEVDWQGIGHLLAHALIGDRPVPLKRDRLLAVQARVLVKMTSR
ncbi:MAG: GntR family transcriptional regulator [Chitinivibrionales bacterium]|nr:GntR family transcriptional regulator [Chitinivibrionales bacterium]